MAILNPQVQAKLAAYTSAQKAANIPQLASDAADYVEAVASVGTLKYSGHRVTVKGGQIFFEGLAITRPALQTALANSGGTDDLAALAVELGALLTP